MDMDFNGDVASLDAEMLQLPEVPPLAIKANPHVAEKLFDQWFSLPDTVSLVLKGVMHGRYKARLCDNSSTREQTQKESERIEETFEETQALGA